MRYIIAILILGLVVLFHEFGHFLFAKLNHVAVLEFAVGMGPKIFSFKRGETVYALKVLPFGGSCSMLGEDEESNEKGSFQSASVGGRISIVAAGPVFNFIMALVFSIIIVAAAGFDPAAVTEVESGSPEAEAGLETGDRIVSYEGNGISCGRELYADIAIDGVPTDEISLTYERNGEKHSITYVPTTEQKYMLGFSYSSEDGTDEGAVVISKVNKDSPMREAGVESGDTIVAINGTDTPTYKDFNDYLEAHPLDGSPVTMTLKRGTRTFTTDEMTPAVKNVSYLGFSFNLAREKQNFIGVITGGFHEVGYWIHVTLKSLGALITGTYSVNDMSGPVGIISTIGNTTSEAAKVSTSAAVLTALSMIVMLSANLGVMNLIPFPALDGGRILLLIIGKIRRKPVNQDIEARINFIGFALLMALMVYITVHDILKLF